MKVYSVIAYRWGNRDGHSYIVGVYEHKSTATAIATCEEYDRGNKYECEVLEHDLNDTDNSKTIRPVSTVSDIDSINKTIEKLTILKKGLLAYENNNQK